LSLTHILFSPSAAGTLRQFLRALGNRERVVGFHEYLDWGPIDVSMGERIEWIELNSPSDAGWDWLSECVEEFRADVANLHDKLIWIAPQNATEQAGLYWYLHHFGGTGANMVVADYALGGAWHDQPPTSLGSLSQEYFGRLLETQPKRWDEARFPQDRWAQLTSDGALLRIVRDGLLLSSPPDFFDEMILQRTPANWTQWYRVVGDTMGAAWDAGHSPDDSLLRWRILEMVRGGRLELDGDLALHGVENAAKIRRV